ncbi:MAG: transcriptional repressor NrdR [Archangium sp.]|nr:transcriptional repressor NrdR [Archangium sp.]
MRCPFCTTDDTRVLDSRESSEGAVIRRRRECESCKRRFTTYERVEELNPLVVKKDGRREAFDRDKLLAGLKKACEKRPVSVDQLERLISDVERRLQEQGEKEVQSSAIGEAVMERLPTLDEVAYVRFASVYRSFRDIAEFMDELKDIVQGHAKRGGREAKGKP